jgi:hypothetical protein
MCSCLIEDSWLKGGVSWVLSHNCHIGLYSNVYVSLLTYNSCSGNLWWLYAQVWIGESVRLLCQDLNNFRDKRSSLIGYLVKYNEIMSVTPVLWIWCLELLFIYQLKSIKIIVRWIEISSIQEIAVVYKNHFEVSWKKAKQSSARITF